ANPNSYSALPSAGKFVFGGPEVVNVKRSTFSYHPCSQAAAPNCISLAKLMREANRAKMRNRN
ncbi:MAG TPA: hypothetical protein VIE90_20790, partial [Candidatus Binatia bacterium]